MAKRYRVYSVNRRNDGDPRHYISGGKASHRWADRETTDTYTPLMAIRKMAHVTGVVRSGGNNRLSFSIEVVQDESS